jgi:energy-coupling factor transport system ATP-binding protein
MIHIKNLSYSYPNASRPALVDINTSVERAEFVLIAGPSGAGKSTLLRSLNGLVPHYSGGSAKGHVYVDGYDVFHAGPKLMSAIVGFVFQNPESQNVLDIVEDELAFGLENAGIPSEEMHDRIDEALEILELGPLRYRPIATLSGGERQRLAVASVLVMRPAVIALDEPTSQLDPSSASELLRYLVRLNQEKDLTILMVEHRLERVARFSHRILYLEEGRLLLDEPIEQGLSHIDLQESPPLTRLWRSLGWDHAPLTTEEGYSDFRDVHISKPLQKGRRHVTSPDKREVLLSVADLRFSFPTREVLSGVNLQIRAGESVALLGKNGSGKSTLLKCVVGLHRPTTGEIELLGESIKDKKVADICRDAAFLPQNPDDLLFAESVQDELAVTLENHGINPDELSIRPQELLQMLGIDAYAQTYPRDLSVGERQRVALGAVIVTEPRVLLLDEPTRGLDYVAKSRLMELWRSWQDHGLGLLLVTHDVELAARACDRVLILEDGIIAADGPTNEVLGADPVFKPQLARLFPGFGWLTVQEALEGIGKQIS